MNPEGFHCTTLPLYDDQTRQTMKAKARALAEGMARGSLTGTAYEDDAEAIRWFVDAFEMWITSELNPDICAGLLATASAEKWRESETRTVVKAWIFGILENCPKDVRSIDIAF